MTPLRRNDGARFRAGSPRVVVDYSDEVTEQQVKKMDELVREEFQSGEWIITEQES